MLKSVLISRIELGRLCLEKLVELGHRPEAIFSLKDDYHRVISDFGSFDEISEREGIPLYKIDDIRFWKRLFDEKYNPSLLRSRENIELIRDCNPDICWLLGWGEIIKPELLEIPRVGWIGSHPTLLPKYRGGAPLVWPIIKGHEKTGATLFWLDKGLDNGDILAQKEFDIAINDTAVDMYDKMIRSYLSLIEESLPLLEKGLIPRIPQKQGANIETWPTRNPKDSKITLQEPEDGRTLLRYIHDQIRAVSGVYPSAFIQIESVEHYNMIRRMIPDFNVSFDESYNKQVILKKSLYNQERDELKILEYEVR